MTNFRLSSNREFPPIVKNIIIINVLMVMIQFVLIKRGVNLGEYLGLHYWDSPKFRWWQPVTHLFMHGDPMDLNLTFWHLFSNMFALWMFGRILENLWGPKRFLIFYFVCGLGAALCHMGVLTFEFTSISKDINNFHQNPVYTSFLNFLKNHDLKGDPYFSRILYFWQTNPGCGNCSELAMQTMDSYYTKLISEATVGASGAVFGVLFAFAYLFPNTELMLIFPPIPIKAKWMVGFYALFELYAGIRNSAGDNIAHYAHIGGMVFAFILLRIWSKTLRNTYY